MGCTSSKTENDTNATNLGGLDVAQADLAAAAVVDDLSLTSRLRLSIACEGLQNTDRGSLSDTFAMVASRSKNNSWVEVGRTEIIANNLSPSWAQMIPIMYRFEEIQNIQVSVYHVHGSFDSCDSSSLPLSEQKLQGRSETTLASIVGAHQQTWVTSLENADLPSQNATLTVKVEEVANQNAKVLLQVSGSGFSSSLNLFLKFSYLTETQSLFPCFKTEVQFDTATPNWNTVNGSLQNLVNGDMYRPLNIDCMSYMKNGQHLLIGSCQTSVQDLVQAAIKNEHLTFTKDGVIAGTLIINKCEIIQEPTFFEYITSGTELAFVAAIDFTASNGDPSTPDSLHYIDPEGKLNSYASAISGIGNILEHYDDDNLFPVYGFGAFEKGTEEVVQHCFNVNGDANPNCEGVKGILNAYNSCLQRMQLHGPTYFAPVINQCAALARSTLTNDPSDQTYYVLLILTDGVIMDMENTTQAIVEAAEDLPLSIIIIGVGDANFTEMEILDGDDVRLCTKGGVSAKHDIVQFVPLKQLQNADAHTIAKEVLDEIPRQLVDYMKSKKILPVLNKDKAL